MTTLALLNEPRCLDLDSFALAPPRAAPGSGTAPCVWEVMNSRNGTARFRAQALRECLDTVAVLRSYREPLTGEVWTLPEGSERRMLAQVNAILALGHGALKQVVDLAIDDDLPDPGRVFASLFVLGFSAGKAWLQPMLSILVAAVERSPAEGAAAIEALCLTPNLEVPGSVAQLLADERPGLRAAAVRVLSFRAELVPSQWHRAIDDADISVATAAANAPLTGARRGQWQRPLERLLDHTSEGLVCAALRAGLTLRLEAAHRRAREISRSTPSWANSLQCLAMFGLRSDEEAIRAVMAGPQCLAAVRAAAVAGRTSLMPDLLALLGDVEPDSQPWREIAQALATITGVTFSSIDTRAAAEQLWARHQDRFDSRQRYRLGEHFHPTVLLRSLWLRQDMASNLHLHSRGSRQQAHIELMAATDGHAPRLNAYDFVARQIVSLQHIESWLAMLLDSRWVAGPLH
jgi:hypothetical protein